MSYEGTKCPCGGKKPANTMLCDGCMTAFADHPAMAVFSDRALDVELRRHAAITLLTLACRRSSEIGYRSIPGYA